ncbi:MAG: polyprenyl synthetase family protein [Gammaproteobacteria bacterium]|jgi:octaprenyl-diphosphate synthase|nr:polyprenyl synthetase family protein [Gammaproteobacteria bacterium]HJL80763.1 polyprenyl synthetase family protein [Gammaproteobacteria bacterium]HJM09686.1 polyprenyl synthetase family protein [Gammaproteobacteria bacterium]HJN01293.1 polyprenyl synthetase family protein [Gammaproteobacteria bacterium]|tara:strand:- start:16756 stop:17760 length:1005 start_codon:yes stop_codon:yes gene_type:complete
MKSVEKISAQKASLNEIRDLVSEEWSLLDQEIEKQLSSDIELINSISQYIVESGGKRIRPLIVLLSAKACGASDLDRVVKAAAMIEFIHTATLLHDDVVDNSDSRRGIKTAHQSYGNESTILVGDFLYSRAFQIMVQINHMAIMEVMSDATNTIAEGEVLQLINSGNPKTNKEQYLEVIYRKTGKLFEASMVVGGLLNNQSQTVINALQIFGKEMGMAYQIVDDVLDYTSSFEIMGKDVGDDLADGKVTLPMIYAIERATPDMQKIISEAILNKDSQNSEEIIECIQTTGSIASSINDAREKTESALHSIQSLDNNKYKKALISLAEIILDRAY